MGARDREEISRLDRRLSIRLDPQTVEELDLLAREQDTTVSELVRRTLSLATLMRRADEAEEGMEPTDLPPPSSGAERYGEGSLIQPTDSRLRVPLPAGLFGPDGLPISDETREGKAMLLDVREVSRDLIARLAADPAELHRLDPYRFEDLVAELLMAQGYEVHSTPRTRDGGKDLVVATRGDLGSFLYLVECKRNSPTNPVSVDVVRKLYGVVSALRATAGMVVTTSRFTQPAYDFQRTVEYQMALHDLETLRGWLNDYLGRPTKAEFRLA